MNIGLDPYGVLYFKMEGSQNLPEGALNLWSLCAGIPTYIACFLLVVLVLSLLHLSRRWRRVTMSGDSCSWSSNNEYCSSSKNEVVTAEGEAEPLGIQDSMLNMNIGHSKTILFHRNGSWLKSAQDAHFLSSSSSSSSSRGGSFSPHSPSHILKPARLRLTHQNSDMNRLHKCELMQTNQDNSNGRIGSRKQLKLKKSISDPQSVISQSRCTRESDPLVSRSESNGVGGASAVAAGKLEGVADKTESIRWRRSCSWIMICVFVLMFLSLFLNVIFVIIYFTSIYS